MSDNVTARDGNGATLAFRTTEVSAGLHVPHHSLADGVLLSGPAAQSVLNTDLLTGTVNGWYDVGDLFSGTIQIIAGAGISAGAVIFEQTNDNSSTVGVALEADELGVSNSNPLSAATTIAASTRRIFAVSLGCKYVRARISTAFVGGTVQAIGFLSQQVYSSPTLSVQQNSAASFLATVTPTTPTQHTLSAAATINATSVKTSAGTIYGLVLTNMSGGVQYFKLYNKASAPAPATDTPVMVIRLAAGSTLDVALGVLGARFTTGIAYCITTGTADTDTTALGAVGDSRVLMNYV